MVAGLMRDAVSIALAYNQQKKPTSHILVSKPWLLRIDTNHWSPLTQITPLSMVFLAHFCGSGGSAYRVLRIIWFQVTSGINRGSNYGHHMLYSGVVAEDREALISGVPSLSISLNWRKDESQENDFKDAVAVCLPLINAAIRDIEKGEFPKSCFLNIEIPSSPLSNKAMAPRSNNTAKAKAIALRMKALQMKRDKKTVSKPAA